MMIGYQGKWFGCSFPFMCLSLAAILWLTMKGVRR